MQELPKIGSTIDLFQLFNISPETNFNNIDQGMIKNNYRDAIIKFHPDKTEAIYRKQAMNYSQYINEGYQCFQNSSYFNLYKSRYFLEQALIYIQNNQPDLARRALFELNKCYIMSFQDQTIEGSDYFSPKNLLRDYIKLALAKKDDNFLNTIMNNNSLIRTGLVHLDDLDAWRAYQQKQKEEQLKAQKEEQDKIRVQKNAEEQERISELRRLIQDKIDKIVKTVNDDVLDNHEFEQNLKLYKESEIFKINNVDIEWWGCEPKDRQLKKRQNFKYIKQLLKYGLVTKEFIMEKIGKQWDKRFLELDYLDGYFQNNIFTPEELLIENIKFNPGFVSSFLKHNAQYTLEWVTISEGFSRAKIKSIEKVFYCPNLIKAMIQNPRTINYFMDEYAWSVPGWPGVYLDALTKKDLEEINSIDLDYFNQSELKEAVNLALSKKEIVIDDIKTVSKNDEKITIENNSNNIKNNIKDSNSNESKNQKRSQVLASLQGVIDYCTLQGWNNIVSFLKMLQNSIIKQDKNKSTNDQEQKMTGRAK